MPQRQLNKLPDLCHLLPHTTHIIITVQNKLSDRSRIESLKAIAELSEAKTVVVTYSQMGARRLTQMRPLNTACPVSNGILMQARSQGHTRHHQACLRLLVQ